MTTRRTAPSRKQPSREVRDAEERNRPVQMLDGKELTKVLQGANGLSEPRPPAPAGLLLMRIIREVYPIVSDLEEKRQEVFAQYGLRRNGKLVEGAVPISQQEAALKEIRDLYAIQHEVRSQPVRWSQFEDQDINPLAFANLGPLGIDDGAEE